MPARKHPASLISPVAYAFCTLQGAELRIEAELPRSRTDCGAGHRKESYVLPVHAPNPELPALAEQACTLLRSEGLRPSTRIGLRVEGSCWTYYGAQAREGADVQAL